MIILDTHALIWLDEGNPRLGSNALEQINQALKESMLFVSTISYWEVEMLSQKKHIEMSIPVDIWRKNLLHNGLQEIPLNADIAIEAARLLDFHGDPADRIITATALSRNARLCTADQKIREWKRPLRILNAIK